MAIGIVFRFHEKKTRQSQTAFNEVMKAHDFRPLENGFAVSRTAQGFEDVYNQLSQYIDSKDCLIAFEIPGKMRRKGLAPALSDWQLFSGDQETQES